MARTRMVPGWEQKVAETSDPTLDNLTSDIAADAKRIVAATSYETGALERGIEAVRASGGQAGVVARRDVPGDSPDVPLFIEFGTEKMPAAPFMRPATYQRRTLR